MSSLPHGKHVKFLMFQQTRNRCPLAMVGIVGSGTMGGGIAMVCANAGRMTIGAALNSSRTGARSFTFLPAS
jgi:hypothetical protein